MKISGFSFVRNATKLYYPVKQSILSVLDIVDEFIVALGDCQPDDRTRQEIESIGSSKVKIIDTRWDLTKYQHGTEYAHQTDIARANCSGDWLLYLQSDEVIHEKYLETIKGACLNYLARRDVEGFLFRYYHFWGDYNHYHKSHAWYPAEIRIIRNIPEIHSWNDAQSFRKIPGFDGLSYREKNGTEKLKVIPLDATVYHYGWVRPPDTMQNKRKEFDRAYQGDEVSERGHRQEEMYFDYGPLSRLNVFRETHPAVMKEWIEKFDWQDRLQLSGPVKPGRYLYKHEKLKYRLLTFLEQTILGGRQIGGFKNYRLIKP